MRNSGLRRINDAVWSLDWALVENVLHPPDSSDGVPFELCTATRDDWDRYVQSEEQAMKSRRMTWWDDRVFIVELPGRLHEGLVDGVREAISEATGTGSTHLAHHGAAYIENIATLPDEINALIALLEPDASFGPCQDLPGAVPPLGFDWGIFHTLKVEIGGCQGWGAQHGQAGPQAQTGQQGQHGQAGQTHVATLHEKANAWRQCPGVEYVLSIHVNWGMNVREYRLDSIVDGQFENPDAQPAPIDNDTVVRFDPWRLLGIPHGGILPFGFHNPVQFDLFDVVDLIIQRRLLNIAFKTATATAAASVDAASAATAAAFVVDLADAAAAFAVTAAEAADAAQRPRRRQRRH